MRTAEFQVAGMSCMGCERSLRGCLSSMSGVLAVDVSFASATATLTVDNAFDAAAAMAAAAKAGFTLTPVTAR